MSKVYEDDDKVIYDNEKGDIWIRDLETDVRTYIPSGSGEPAGSFDHDQEINNDSCESEDNPDK